MRIHFGFSKRIKPSFLLKFLGFLFLGLLAFIGLLDHAYAWTDIQSNQTLVFNSFNGEYYDLNNNSIPQKYNGTDIIRRGSSPYYSFGINDNTTEYWLNINAVSQGYINLEPTYGPRILSYSELGLNNPGYCPNSTTDLKSMNIKFPVYVDNYLTDYSFFNQINQSSTISFRMVSYDDIHDYKFTTTCSHEVISGASSNYYLVTCNNVFAGNSNYSVDRYGIQINNSVPFNDFYSASTQSKAIGFWYEIGPRMVSFQNANIKYLFSYECSDNDPVLNEPIPGGDDDPAGLNDIYDNIKGNFDSSIAGIDTSKFLTIPAKFSDLLFLPFDIAKVLIDNSTNTCEDYVVPLTINNKTTNFTFPCMRETLSDYLGSLYTLIDLLICFYLFYDIAMHIVSLINALITGQDLYTYFFKSSTNNSYADNYTGGEH